MTDTFSTFTDTGLSAVLASAGSPLLLTNATVHTFDPTIGTLRGADLLIGGSEIVGVGPGIVTAAADDGATVIDATGTSVLPARPDLTGRNRGGARTGPGTLAPGSEASFVIVDDEDAQDRVTALSAALSRPDHVRAVFEAGAPVRWDGKPLEDQSELSRLEPPEAAPTRVGVWVDTEGFLYQKLSADGRYDETRGGRPHAFQGRYWVDGDRIDYLDDLGFWAFGTFDGDTLRHAGYTMMREETR